MPQFPSPVARRTSSLRVARRRPCQHERVTDQTDAAVVASVLNGRLLNGGYDVVSVVALAGSLELRIHVTEQDEVFGLVVPDPNSDNPQPWVYVQPVDLKDWANMLAFWLDENLTAGSEPFATVIRDGLPFFLVEPYGLRYADPPTHSRMTRLSQRW